MPKRFPEFDFHTTYKELKQSVHRMIDWISTHNFHTTYKELKQPLSTVKYSNLKSISTLPTRN